MDCVFSLVAVVSVELRLMPETSLTTFLTTGTVSTWFIYVVHKQLLNRKYKFCYLCFLYLYFDCFLAEFLSCSSFVIVN